MKKTVVGVLALGVPILAATSAPATETATPFHATLKLVEDCESSAEPSEACQHFQEWLQACWTKGYSYGFQAVRRGWATQMGSVTSFEQGCLEVPASGKPSIYRSYVQLTITARNGETLSAYAAGLFDFAHPTAAGTGTFAITGGTGRFTGALGSGTTGNITIGGNPGAVIYQDGFLRLPRSKR